MATSPDHSQTTSTPQTHPSIPIAIDPARARRLPRAITSNIRNNTTSINSILILSTFTPSAITSIRTRSGTPHFPRPLHHLAHPLHPQQPLLFPRFRPHQCGKMAAPASARPLPPSPRAHLACGPTVKPSPLGWCHPAPDERARPRTSSRCPGRQPNRNTWNIITTIINNRNGKEARRRPQQRSRNEPVERKPGRERRQWKRNNQTTAPPLSAAERQATRSTIR